MSLHISKNWLFLSALAVAVLSTSVASAQAVRRADSKVRGDFGTNIRAPNWAVGRPRTYNYSYSYSAPQVVRIAPQPAVVTPAPAPAPSVAQAPTARRAFSYQPGTQTAPQVAAAPQTSVAPATNYFYGSRRSVRRAERHYPSYERADSKVRGHFGY